MQIAMSSGNLKRAHRGAFRDAFEIGRLLVRHTYAAGHNAFREGGSRSKARARGDGPQLGFLAFRFDRACLSKNANIRDRGSLRRDTTAPEASTP